MTENKDEGFHQYPDEITLGQRLTKADVEHRKMLYKKSLDEKWYAVQNKIRLMWGPCAFCRDAGLIGHSVRWECSKCKIAPILCRRDDDGYKGLFFQIINIYSHDDDQYTKLVDQMVSEMEARIKDCDAILKAMAVGNYDTIVDSETIV